jgi:hypothetical protein
VTKSIEHQISEQFEQLIPKTGLPVDPYFPAPSPDPDHMSSQTRVAASIPLINTDLSKSLFRANAIAEAVCALEVGERGNVLLNAASVFEAADDTHRNKMLIAAINDVSLDHKNIANEVSGEAMVDGQLKRTGMADGRFEAAAFLLKTYYLCNENQRYFIDKMLNNDTLNKVFVKSDRMFGSQPVGDGLENTDGLHSQIVDSLRLKQKYWDNVESRSYNEHLETRGLHERQRGTRQSEGR